MRTFQLQILPVKLLDDYLNITKTEIERTLLNLTDSNLSTSNFSFYTSVAAVFSSKIEGEAIEMDSFLKHKLTEARFKPDYTQKTDDLVEAYLFAQTKPLNKANIDIAHSLITRHILTGTQQGILRKGNMFVVTPDGKIEYVACVSQQVPAEMNKLYADIHALMTISLTADEAFYFASMIHLVFVKIHPYQDGNGRMARLIEKWFIAEKLGAKAWLLQSEKYYYEQHGIYYQNIRRIGIEYDNLNYDEALPFLQMLQQSIS